jgi:GNAT superfamily N-acetyltransferase
MDRISGGLMNGIVYKNTHHFSKKELEDLFLSVEWSSGHFPEKLVIAMKNFETVFSAWDEDKLVGMVCAMDDGIMTAYVHYLLVRPDYQLKGIGKELVERVKNHYKDYMRIVVVAYDDEMKFYEYCGFEKADDASVMFITELWT